MVGIVVLVYLRVFKSKIKNWIECEQEKIVQKSLQLNEEASLFNFQADSEYEAYYTKFTNGNQSRLNWRWDLWIMCKIDDILIERIPNPPQKNNNNNTKSLFMSKIRGY